MIYDGKEKADPANPKHATGAQLKVIALATVSDPKYAIDAQSAKQAVQQLNALSVAGGTFDYIVFLDHGRSDMLGRLRQELGNSLIGRNHLADLAPFLNSGGAFCFFGCRAGLSDSYMQDNATGSGRDIWGFKMTVALKKTDPLPSPNPSGGDWFVKHP